MGFRRLLQSVDTPFFRWYFSGQFLSLSGTWMQRVAEAWLAWELTNSAWMLGFVSFCGLFPGIFTNFISGALLDRFPKRTIILITQYLLAAQALVLAVLTFTGFISIWVLVVLTIFQALVSGADMPARQSLLGELADKERLTQVIAMNSITVNVGRILGPALAALVIPLGGNGLAFLLNAMSFILLIGVVHQMPKTTVFRESGETTLFNQISEGWKYVTKHPVIGPYLLLFGSCNLLGMFYASLLPVFSAEKYATGSVGLSVMLSSSGVGALLGAVFVGGWVRPNRLAAVLRWSSVTMGISLIGLGLSPGLLTSSLILALGGFSMMIQISGTNMLLQSETENALRGRVMSFYTFTFSLGTPLGNLWAGALAEWLTVEIPFYAGGTILLLFALFIKSRIKKDLLHA